MNNYGTVFLEELRIKLSHLPSSEVEKVISFYSESLQDKIEDGMSEEDAVKSFGPTDDIVKAIEDEIPLTTIVRDKVASKTKKGDGSKSNKLLIFVIIVLTFPIWVTILGLLFGLVVACLAIIFTIPVVIGTLYASLFPIALFGIFLGVIRMLTLSFATGLGYLGVGFVSLGLIFILFKPMVYLAKKLVQLILYPFKKLKAWLLKK